MRERLFSFTQDYWVTDDAGHRAFLVSGKMLSLRRAFEVKGPDGQVYALARKKLPALRTTMQITSGGRHVATIRRKLFSPIWHRFTIALADGERWEAVGDLIEKNYTIEGPQGVVAQTSRRWFRIRDSYGVDVYHPDVPVTLAIVACVDELVAAARHE